MKTRYIDPEVARELLHYDPETGVFTWKERDRSWFSNNAIHRSWNARYAGKKAGTVKPYPNGYQNIQISLAGQQQYAHRVAWVWMTGEQPPEDIDHKDRDATNNCWSNIRAGGAINRRNLSLFRNNTSGVTGVSRCSRTGHWVASCRLDRTTHHLGTYKTKDEAAAVVTKFRAEHGFDPQHGLAPAHYAKSEARHV